MVKQPLRFPREPMVKRIASVTPWCDTRATDGRTCALDQSCLALGTSYDAAMKIFLSSW